MIEHVVRHTIPAALSLLPTEMDTPAARAMLVAIGLQESKFLFRRQKDYGPARSFWQFEKGGVRGVLRHPSTRGHVIALLRALRYDHLVAPATGQVANIHVALEHNDVLACAFARLNLWWLPTALPAREQSNVAWSQYLEAWRPGKPHVATWESFYSEAWERITLEKRNA